MAENSLTAIAPRPLDLQLTSHTIDLGGGPEAVINIASPRRVASLVQYGTPGPAPEFRVDGTTLQYRLVGGVTWIDLVDLALV